MKDECPSHLEFEPFLFFNLQRALKLPPESQRLTHYGWDPLEELGDESFEVHKDEVKGRGSS